jgi:hypothetical protein
MFVLKGRFPIGTKISFVGCFLYCLAPSLPFGLQTLLLGSVILLVLILVYNRIRFSDKLPIISGIGSVAFLVFVIGFQLFMFVLRGLFPVG